ncbi:type II toxin-antitoxin system HicB family antitoxin [Natronomonas amylolytica]|uniref:type II toxin-antitoxin system HicB family antitoxin n=1 Tax=Natronomonas amylolytica TaxID=3108498 RepID=UPI00300976CA
MAIEADSDDADSGREIRLTENPDGRWTARDLRAEVSTQGETRTEALEALDAVVAALEGDAGREPTDEEMEALGVDPETARSQGDELPDVLQ